MATYFLQVKTFARDRGGRVTRAAAYRAGERIRDERTSDVYNFTCRADVAHKEIILGDEFCEREDMQWALDRATLWNAAEHSGHRRNSLLAREVFVLLPPELSAAQRTELVRAFAKELANRYRNAVDVTIHCPRPGADQRHHHAHLLLTPRELTPKGLGERTTLELSGTERRARGLGPSKSDYLEIRERWAVMTNEALSKAGIDARIDHRSYKKQGLDREPAAVIPQKVYYAEKKSGINTPAGDDIRARHRERVDARSKGEDELARVIARQTKECRERASEQSATKADPPTIAHSALTREELNQRRRERYRKSQNEKNMKAQTFQSHEGPKPTGNTVAVESAPTAREPLTPSERAALEEAAAIRSWREYREHQKQHEELPSVSREQSKQQGVAEMERDTKTDGDPGNTGRRRDTDYSL